jgi:hypothetical protein
MTGPHDIFDEQTPYLSARPIAVTNPFAKNRAECVAQCLSLLT